MSDLSLEVEKLDAVPEAVRSFYEERDGKYRLKVQGVEDTAGLKSALQKERERGKAAEKWEKLGKTPDEIQEAFARLDAIETDKQKASGNFEAVQKKLMDQFAQKEAVFQSTITSLTEHLRKATVENTMMAALQKAGITSEGIDVLPEVLVKRVKVDMVDGAMSVKVFQADGVTPMLGKKGEATVEDLVAFAVEKYPSLFAAQGKSGSGKPPNSSAGGAGGKTISAEKLSAMTPMEKAKFFRENPGVTVQT